MVPALADGDAARPVPIATVCVVLLLALGIPFTGIKFIGVDASGVPKGLLRADR